MSARFMRFPGGKGKAVTLSYDDSIEADAKLIAMMQKYGVKGTFNLIPGWFAEEGTTYPEGETYCLVSPKKALDIYAVPQVEVANHGDTHSYMTTLTTAEMAAEMIACRRKLETLFSRNVRGMAYPYGWYNEELKKVLSMCGVVYSRTVNSTHDFELPEDFLEWHPTCHHDEPELMQLTEAFVGMEVREQPKLFYLWGHTFEFERNKNWEVMENFLEKVSGNDDTWYATNIEIYEYVKAYERLEISADGKRIVNPSKIPVWFRLDKTIYKVEDMLVLE